MLNKDASICEDLKDQIIDSNGIPKTAQDFRWVLLCLTEEQRRVVFESLGGRLNECIKTERDFWLMIDLVPQDVCVNVCNKILGEGTDQATTSRLEWIQSSKDIDSKFKLNIFCDFVFKAFNSKAGSNGEVKFTNTDPFLLKRIKDGILENCKSAQPGNIDAELVEKAGQVLAAGTSSIGFFSENPIKSEDYQKHVRHWSDQAQASSSRAP